MTAPLVTRDSTPGGHFVAETPAEALQGRGFERLADARVILHGMDMLDKLRARQRSLLDGRRVTLLRGSRDPRASTAACREAMALADAEVELHNLIGEWKAEVRLRIERMAGRAARSSERAERRIRREDGKGCTA